MADKIDYRKMLLAYIDWVGKCEGVDFLNDGPLAYLDGLSDEEAVELAKMRDIGRMAERRFYDESGEPQADMQIEQAPVMAENFIFYKVKNG